MLKTNIECSEHSCRKTFPTDNGGFQINTLLKVIGLNESIVIEIGKVNIESTNSDTIHVCGKNCLHKEIERIINESISK
jgi:hypothetical protein